MAKCPHRTRGGRSYCDECSRDDARRHAQRVRDTQLLAQVRENPICEGFAVDMETQSRQLLIVRSVSHNNLGRLLADVVELLRGGKHV